LALGGFLSATLRNAGAADAGFAADLLVAKRRKFKRGCSLRQNKAPGASRGLFCAADSPFKIDLSRR
jgi:hypothetical protein